MTTSIRATDHELHEAVTEELGWLPSIQADRVAVCVDRGAVTLSGQVDTYPQKDAAVQAAFRVRGVNAVADEIEVRHDLMPVQDADIARAAGDVLTRTAPAGAVKADVHHRVVTLTGTVTWNYQREAVAEAVAAIDGVLDVTSRLDLVPDVAIHPVDASSQLLAALHRNAEIDADQVAVAVDGTTVTLTGRVGSWWEHRQAARAAWSTPGVTAVENQLTVVF